MLKKIDGKKFYKDQDFSMINQNQKNINNESSIDHSFINHSSIKNNAIFTPLGKKSISPLFLNCHSTYYKNRLNKYLKTLDNYPCKHQNLKNNTIKLFDRPIYNFIFPENNKNSSERLNINCLSSHKNASLDISERKSKFDNLFLHINSKRKRINLMMNNKNKKTKNIEYFPKLLDLKNASMINKKNDKYKDKNILFIKLKDLNFEAEMKNTTRKNFITPDKYLFINSNDKANFLEKKTTYKILENIKFKFNSPIDKSKLQKFITNFNSFYSVNKFY